MMLEVIVALTATLPLVETREALVTVARTPLPMPLPMLLCASDAPTEMPTPTAPTPIEAAAEITRASIAAAPVATSEMEECADRLILSTTTWVVVVITF